MLNTSVTNTHGGRIDGSWIAKNGTSSVDSSGTNQQIKDIFFIPYYFNYTESKGFCIFSKYLCNK